MSASTHASIVGAGAGARSAELVLAVDLGGTQIRTALVDAAGTMIARRSVPTPKIGGPDIVMAAVVEEVRQTWSRSDRPVQAIGVSALGPVEPDHGLVRSAPTLPGFVDVPVGALLRSAFPVPVHVYNDANCATIAEWRLGAGRGTQDFTYVTVSTGIGCGIIANGHLLTGRSGFAGEFGRLQVKTATGYVRLEEISSGTAIAKTARTALAEGAASALSEHGDHATVTAADVADAARRGDPLAQEILRNAAEVLSIQLANLIRITDTAAIAIGGGVILAGDTFWNPLRASLEASLAVDAIPLPQLSQAELQGDSGLLGAALGVAQEAR